MFIRDFDNPIKKQEKKINHEIYFLTNLILKDDINKSIKKN
jgi:hypothetical protein